jgi:molybdopterin-binding aldehyde dehydrogenase-like protein
VIADVSVDVSSGATKVERAWSAVDAGLVINPDGVRNQIEGEIRAVDDLCFGAIRISRLFGPQETTHAGDYAAGREPIAQRDQNFTDHHT